MYSPESAPDAAGDAATRAQVAARVLGPQLARHVMAPLKIGLVGTRSYSVVPLLQPLASVRPLWWLQRHRIQKPLFDWLFHVADRTSAPTDADAVLNCYAVPLEVIADTDGIDAPVKAAAANACMRLRARRWVPRQCLMHGDLWHGNLMMKARSGPMPSWAARLTVIDWGGCRVDGYPVFDLLVAADSLRTPPALAQKELRRHATLLSCELEDATAYALAAVGSFLVSPGCAPVERLCQLANRIYQVAQGRGPSASA